MPDFIVTQTQQEYTAYQKKQEREANQKGYLAFIIVMSGLCGLWWWLQP